MNILSFRPMSGRVSAIPSITPPTRPPISRPTALPIASSTSPIIFIASTIGPASETSIPKAVKTRPNMPTTLSMLKRAGIAISANGPTVARMSNDTDMERRSADSASAVSKEGATSYFSIRPTIVPIPAIIIPTAARPIKALAETLLILLSSFKTKVMVTISAIIDAADTRTLAGSSFAKVASTIPSPINTLPKTITDAKALSERPLNSPREYRIILNSDITAMSETVAASIPRKSCPAKATRTAPSNANTPPMAMTDHRAFSLRPSQLLRVLSIIANSAITKPSASADAKMLGSGACAKRTRPAMSIPSAATITSTDLRSVWKLLAILNIRANIPITTTRATTEVSKADGSINESIAIPATSIPSETAMATKDLLDPGWIPLAILNTSASKSINVPIAATPFIRFSVLTFPSKYVQNEIRAIAAAIASMFLATFLASAPSPLIKSSRPTTTTNMTNAPAACFSSLSLILPISLAATASKIKEAETSIINLPAVFSGSIPIEDTIISATTIRPNAATTFAAWSN